MSEHPTAFSFGVLFEGIADAVQFQGVSGLEAAFDIENVVEGGENRFVHQLPNSAKPANAVLQRATSDPDCALVKWCKDTLEGGLDQRVQPKQLTITLQDAHNTPVACWTLANAFPVKLRLGDLDAMKNTLAIELIELSYSSLKRDS